MTKLPSIFKRSPIATIETALGNLAARRATLEARLADATARLDASRSARKAALESDPAADLGPLTTAVRNAEDEVSTINGVLDDLAAQEEQQMIALDRARDDDQRAASAKTLETIAGKMDRATEDLEAAVSEVARAAIKMLALLPPTLAVVTIDERLPEGQSEQQRLIAIVLADALAAVLPWAVPMTFWGGAFNSGHTAGLSRFFDLGGYIRTVTPIVEQITATPSAAVSARALMTDRLRARAKAILAGDLPPELDDVDVVAIERLKPRPSIAAVEVYALQNFAFRLQRRDAPQIIGALWAQSIPEDVADIAVASGVAFRTDTPEGAKALADRKAARARSSSSLSYSGVVTFADCVDIGVIRPADDFVDAA